MPRPRKRLVSLDDTPYYHCISRCVRRAFLCGVDRHSGKNFEHRRQWIVDRILLLSSVFTIDVCAYAVMSNHYHVVLHVDRERARELSPREFARRWLRLFSWPPGVQCWLKDGVLSAAEQRQVEQWLELAQRRLSDISWFMRCLNEPIARMANAEDRCTGRFWEGRFKSQALLDDAALLQCMTYVDLNPIRAGLAKTPEGSDFTSIQRRLQTPSEHGLMPFGADARELRSIPSSTASYLELVDWSGRVVVAGKRGAIPSDTPPIMERLRFDPVKFARYLRTRPETLPNALGPISSLRRMAKSFGLKFIHGVSGCYSVLEIPSC